MNEDLIALGGAIVVGSIGRAVIDFGLSFSALSPLIMGGIIAVISTILVVNYILSLYAQKSEPGEENILGILSDCVLLVLQSELDLLQLLFFLA